MQVLVIGAGKPLGAQVALTLAAEGHDVMGTRRSSFGLDRRLIAGGVQLAELDVRDRIAVREASKHCEAVVMTPILSVAEPAIIEFVEAGITRGVAFSSNNVAVSPDNEVYKSLAAAEERVLAAAPDWAIIRPTMIYGHPNDGNLSRLLSHTARWPVLPMPGTGEAAQQPLHLDDLARLAAALVLGMDEMTGVLTIGGPEVLTQYDLVKLACQVTGNRCRPVKAPIAPLRMWAETGLPSPVTTAQLDRVALDKRAVSPADLPDELLPKISPRDGLERLARDMGLTRPHR